jgi:hypothetical protein
MNGNTPFRLRRTIALGVVVTAAIVTPTAAVAIGPAYPPAGATVGTGNPTVGAMVVPAYPPAGATVATVNPAAGAKVGQAYPPAGATVATVNPAAGAMAATATPVVPASTGRPANQPGPGLGAPSDAGRSVTPVTSSPVVEVPSGFGWGDAGMGAGVAFGGILLLGGALLVVRRSGQRARLATD